MSSYEHALALRKAFQPKAVCYDSATDTIRRYVRPLEDVKGLRMTHHAVLEPCGEHWFELIKKFLLDPPDTYAVGA